MNKSFFNDIRNNFIKEISVINSRNINYFQKIFECIFISIIFNLQIVRNYSGLNFLDHLNISLIFFIFFIFSYCDLYKSYRVKKLGNLLQNIFFATFYIALYVIIYSSFFGYQSYIHSTYFYLWILETFLIIFINHFLMRLLLRRIRKDGKNFRNILFVGNKSSHKLLSSKLNQNPWYGYKISAWFFNENESFVNQDTSIHYGYISNLEKWLTFNKVDKIIFNPSNMSNNEIKNLIKIFGNTSIPTVLMTDWMNNTMRLSVDYLDDSCLIDLWGNDINSLVILVKRIFDIFFSLIVILITSPLLIFISILIKINSKGPVIFKQERYGLDGKSFYIYKFRSMKVVESGSKKGLKQAKKNDPRVTKLGSILRKWSLDELPQFINVIEGKMSVVGPRPHAIEHNEQYRKLISGYMQRHAFKPGITGLAQIMDLRGETKSIKEMKKRVELDLIYQREWNLILDLKIILKTILKFKSTNSY